MTIGTGVSESSYVADGAATPRAIGFPIGDPIYLIVEVDGVVQTLGADYTISGFYSTGGGVIVPQVAWASGAKVRYYRESLLLQEAALPAGQPLPSRKLETQLDRDVMRIQEIGREIERTVRVPRGEAGLLFPAKAQRANTLPIFDADGQIASLNDSNKIVALSGTGQPYGLPVIEVLREIGTTIIDDGAWGEPIFSDDGVWG